MKCHLFLSHHPKPLPALHGISHNYSAPELFQDCWVFLVYFPTSEPDPKGAKPHSHGDILPHFALEQACGQEWSKSALLLESLQINNAIWLHPQIHRWRLLEGMLPVIGGSPHMSCLQSARPLHVMAPLTTTALWITSASMPGFFWWIFHSTYSGLSFLDDLHLHGPLFSKVTGVLKWPFPHSWSGFSVPSSPGSCANAVVSGTCNRCSRWHGSERPLQFPSRTEVARFFYFCKTESYGNARIRQSITRRYWAMGTQDGQTGEATLCRSCPDMTWDCTVCGSSAGEVLGCAVAYVKSWLLRVLFL